MISSRPRRLIVAPDKFRGTATAAEVCAAVARAAGRAGLECLSVPMSDGGEGMLEAFGGANRTNVVTGPLGVPVSAQWRLEPNGLAVIETAQACGLELAGGATGNDPIAATTRGVGELLIEAVRAGATRIIAGLGGSATTDGGGGARSALEAAGVRFGEACVLEICCDVSTPFTKAAEVFGPQKGATSNQIVELTERLEGIRRLAMQAGRDLDTEPGTGAAGGLAGGLALAGGVLQSGFETIARARGLDRMIGGGDLVVTGEGKLDASSLTGKVVGGVVGLARRAGARVVIIAGRVEPGLDLGERVQVIDLSATFGVDRSMGETVECIERAMTDALE